MSKDLENNDGNKEPNNFGLPEGYFNHSANSIFNKIEWMEEHKQYPRLSVLKKESGFVVPVNYFEASESDLELISYPNLFKQKKDPGFIVPQNYFDELEVNELSKVLLDSESELGGFDVLNSIKKKNVFAIDENYFKSSEEKISSAIHLSAESVNPITIGSVDQNGKTKVIRLFSAKLWYSAAAAIFAITLGIWIYNQYFKPVVVGDCGTLACVDKKDLLKAKNLETLDREELYELVDTKKLEEKLEGKTKENTKKEKDTTSKDIDPEDVIDEL